MSRDASAKLRHPSLAEDLLAGRYEPPDDLFRRDRRKYAEEVRKLEEEFRTEALRAAGLEGHPLGPRVLQVAQCCVGGENRMALLKCLIQIADLVRTAEGGGAPTS